MRYSKYRNNISRGHGCPLKSDSPTDLFSIAGAVTLCSLNSHQGRLETLYAQQKSGKTV